MKILIIEDDGVVAVMQKMWITKTSDYAAKILSNGLEAVNYLDSIFKDTPEETYFILLDLNMPIMNGWEFLEILKQRVYASQVSVIVVSSSKFKEDYEMAKKSTLVIDFLHKPIGPNCLKKFFVKGELRLNGKKVE